MRLVMFSVQAIAFDIKHKKLIGEKAIEDINKGVMRINNLRTYEWTVAKYGDKISLKAVSKKLKLRPLN